MAISNYIIIKTNVIFSASFFIRMVILNIYIYIYIYAHVLLKGCQHSDE